MTKRDVIRRVLEGGEPPYVPWQFGFTLEARETLRAHCGAADLEPFCTITFSCWAGRIV